MIIILSAPIDNIQAAWQNVPNRSQQEVFTNQMGHPVALPSPFKAKQGNTAVASVAMNGFVVVLPLLRRPNDPQFRKWSLLLYLF